MLYTLCVCVSRAQGLDIHTKKTKIKKKRENATSLHWLRYTLFLPLLLSAKYQKKRKILTSLGSRVLRLPPGQRVGYIECDEIGPSNRLTTIYILFLSLFLAIS